MEHFKNIHHISSEPASRRRLKQVTFARFEENKNQGREGESNCILSVLRTLGGDWLEQVGQVSSEWDISNIEMIDGWKKKCQIIFLGVSHFLGMELSGVDTWTARNGDEREIIDSGDAKTVTVLHIQWL